MQLGVDVLATPGSMLGALYEPTPHPPLITLPTGFVVLRAFASNVTATNLGAAAVVSSTKSGVQATNTETDLELTGTHTGAILITTDMGG